jgi:hypothetical protein
MKILAIVSLLLALALTAGNVHGASHIFGRPSYQHATVINRWGTHSYVADHSRAELFQSTYTAVAGGAKVGGWMHEHFVWDGDSGPATARFDFALCAEVALGTAISSVSIGVHGFLRDVSAASYPIDAMIYHYSRTSMGYEIFIDGDVINEPVEMVKGHRYTIGYYVDVSAFCYPRSYCPMAHANMGEQGCSFWWQPTGVFEG